MRGTALRPTRQFAGVDHVPRVHEHKQRRFCVYYQPCDDSTRSVFVHNNCVCNELVALRNRVIFECPKPQQAALRRLHLLARRVADWIPRESKSADWWDSYRGRKRQRYRDAADSLNYRPLSKRDSYIKAFVKPEKVFEVKDPRLIQARSPRYNVAIGAYLKPIEHHLYRLRGTRQLRHVLPPGLVIAKGHNMSQRATLLKEKWNRFNNPICFSLDASRFDAHVNELLLVEHHIYRRYWRDPELDRLLAWQVNNRGRTAGGIRYHCRYGRMSGDMNTALGNCLLSVLMAADYMRRKGIKWDMLCDGDDTLLIVEKRDAHLLDDITPAYLEYGMVVKLIVANTWHDITFCHTFPCSTVIGERLVSHPERVLSRALVGVRHWDNPKFIRKYLSLIGYCELALNMGVPVLQEFACMMLAWGEGFPTKWITSGHVLKALREERKFAIEPRRITPEARLDFELATGMSVEQQRALEGAFRALSRHKDASQTQAITKAKTTDEPVQAAIKAARRLAHSAGPGPPTLQGPLHRLARWG
nr:MAG: RNA-dependent RNA polymerase [Riboviria sp.]